MNIDVKSLSTYENGKMTLEALTWNPAALNLIIHLFMTICCHLLHNITTIVDKSCFNLVNLICNMFLT